MYFYQLFLILINVSYQQGDIIQVFINQEALIDVYDKSGIILEQELTEQSFCEIRPQQLMATNIENHSLTLIHGYEDSEFGKYFDYGKFKGKIDKLLKFVQISNGSLVLTDSGQLHYVYYFKGDFIKKQIFQLDIEKEKLQTKAFLEYFYKEQQVIIFLDQLTIGLDLTFDDDDLHINQYRIYEKLNTYQVNSISTTGNILIVAMDNGIKMYEIKNKMLNELYLSMEDIGNVQDVKIFNKNNQNIYFIFLLIKNKGVQAFTYHLGTLKLTFNNKLGTIPYSGEIFDILNGVLMIAQDTTLFELNINYLKNTYSIVKEHKLETEIIDIDLTNMFAIVIGKNGHQIVFHSIPSTHSEFEWKSQLVIPNLSQLDIGGLTVNLQQQNTRQLFSHDIIIGITKHQFFYSNIELVESALICYSQNETKEISFTYRQLSTNCSEKSQVQNIALPSSPAIRECTQFKNYTIQFISPQKFGGNKQTYHSLVWLYSLALILFILLMALLIKQFLGYQYFINTSNLAIIESNNVTLNIKTDINQKHRELQSDKCIPISREDQTPMSEFRDQLNQQLHQNRPVTQENCDMSPGVSAFR